MNEKVSIIIPVYNAGNKILLMLQDVANQSHTNLEVILVNDGSTDESAKFCMSCKDSRIKYLETDNKGPSHARNLGLKNATGEYLFFCDADDRLAHDHIESLLRFIKNEKAELVSNRADRNNLTQNVEVVNKQQAAYKILYNDLYGGFLWNKIFVTDIIKKNDIWFNTDYWICEDLVFILTYLKYCNRVVFVNDCTYFYEQNQGISRFSINHHRLTEFYAKRYIKDQLIFPNDRKTYELATNLSVSVAIRFYYKLFIKHGQGHGKYEYIQKDLLEEIHDNIGYYVFHCSAPIKLKIVGVIVVLRNILMKRD